MPAELVTLYHKIVIVMSSFEPGDFRGDAAPAHAKVGLETEPSPLVKSPLRVGFVCQGSTRTVPRFTNDGCYVFISRSTHSTVIGASGDTRVTSPKT